MGQTHHHHAHVFQHFILHVDFLLVQQHLLIHVDRGRGGGGGRARSQLQGRPVIRPESRTANMLPLALRRQRLGKQKTALRGVVVGYCVALACHARKSIRTTTASHGENTHGKDKTYVISTTNLCVRICVAFLGILHAENAQAGTPSQNAGDADGTMTGHCSTDAIDDRTDHAAARCRDGRLPMNFGDFMAACHKLPRSE